VGSDYKSHSNKWLHLSSDFAYYFVGSQRKFLFKLSCLVGQEVLYEALQPTNHKMVIWNILRHVSHKNHQTFCCLVLRTAAAAAPTSLKHKYLRNVTAAEKCHLLLAVHFIRSLYTSHSTSTAVWTDWNWFIVCGCVFWGITFILKLMWHIWKAALIWCSRLGWKYVCDLNGAVRTDILYQFWIVRKFSYFPDWVPINCLLIKNCWL